MLKYSTKQIKGRRGDDYTLYAMKFDDFKPCIVMCNCKGYMYRKKCWHTRENSPKNELWNDAEWKELETM